MIHCLFVAKGSLNDYARIVLLAAAVELMRSERASKQFKADQCEGRVRTEFRTCVLGGISGVKFAAVIESEHGTAKIEYLVEPRDLNEGINRAAQEAVESGEGSWTDIPIRFTDDDLRAFHAVPPRDAYVN